MIVLLFVVNGIISIITLNDSMKLSHNISTVVDPSLMAVEDFQDMLAESKMYSTNWVFLRSNQADTDALQKLGIFKEAFLGVLQMRFKKIN